MVFVAALILVTKHVYCIYAPYIGFQHGLKFELTVNGRH